uniref:MADF domain-containing protein n=1 Tax=Heliothis virescens TaxID=7102 RepID=A0A2A4J4R7_HELVI
MQNTTTRSSRSQTTLYTLSTNRLPRPPQSSARNQSPRSARTSHTRAMKKEKMMERFTEAQMYQLVNIYKQYDCLWDVSNELYKNRTARDNAYREILKQLNIPELKVRHVPQKIKNLRTSYYQEIRKIEASMKDGVATYKPKVSWFPIADEILRTIPNNRERSETGSEPETSSKRFKKSTETKLLTLDQAAKTVPQTTYYYEPQTKNMDDEFDSFGKYIASSLRAMSQEMSIIAKMELQKTMAGIQLQAIRRKSSAPQVDCAPSTSGEQLLDPLEEFTPVADYCSIKVEMVD